MQAHLESQLRERGEIGSSLQAEVALTAPAGELHDALASLEDDLRFVLITSAARLSEGAADSELAIDAKASAPQTDKAPARK